MSVPLPQPKPMSVSVALLVPAPVLLPVPSPVPVPLSRPLPLPKPLQVSLPPPLPPQSKASTRATTGAFESISPLTDAAVSVEKGCVHLRRKDVSHHCRHYCRRHIIVAATHNGEGGGKARRNH